MDELALLTNCFTVTVKLEDVPAIRFRLRKRAVGLQDVGQVLGHVATAVDADELKAIGHTPQSFVKWLEANGAKKVYIPPKTKRVYYPLYD